MSDFIIDKNIPITKNRPHKLRKFPLEEMEVGDSFFVSDLSSPRVTSVVCMHKKRHQNGKKWITRTVIEGGVKGIRVWRTE